MDALDRFLNRVAYKFDKGYPDVNNPKDMEMLFEMANNILSEVTDAEEGIEILKREFDFKDEDFKKVSGTRYKVLVPRAERFDYAQKMDAIEGFTFDPNAKGSSMGAVLYKGATYLLKPSGAQGRASAGTENEDVLSNELKKYLEDGPKNVVFVGQNKNYATRAIKDVKDVGYDVAGGKKADVVLIGDKDYPISIKKDNAGFWESSDTRYKDVVNKLSVSSLYIILMPSLTLPSLSLKGLNVNSGAKSPFFIFSDSLFTTSLYLVSELSQNPALSFLIEIG